MMGPFSTAILVAGLTVLRALLWLAAGLLAMLVAMQALRGEAAAQPVPMLMAAATFAVVGWISGRIARRILPPA